MNEPRHRLIPYPFFSKIFYALTGVMLISVIIIGVASYSISSHALKQQVYEKSMSQLTAINTRVDELISSSARMSNSLGGNKQIIQFLRNPETQNTQEILDIWALLYSISNNVPCVESVYLYSASNETLYTTDYGKVSAADYKDTDWMDALADDRPRYVQGIYMLPTRVVKRDSNSYDVSVITMVRDINISNKTIGQLVINISEKALQEELEDYFYDKDIIYMIMDSKDNLYSSSEDTFFEKEINLGVNNVYAAYEDSGEMPNISINATSYLVTINDLQFSLFGILLIPKSIISAPAAAIIKLVMIVVAGLIVIGVFVLYMISKVIYKPINRLMEFTATPDKNAAGKDEFAMLESNFMAMKNNVSYLEESMKNAKKWYRSSCLKELLESDDEAVIEETINDLRHNEIEFVNGNILVFIVEVPFDPQSSYNGFTEKISSDFEASLSENYTAFCLKIRRQLVFILNAKTIKRADAYNTITNLTKIVVSKYGKPLTVGIGNVVDHLSVNNSYETAKKALKRKFVEGISGIYTALEKSSENLVYRQPITNICELLYDMDIEGAKTELNKLMEDIVSSNIDYQMIQKIYFSLYIRIYFFIEKKTRSERDLLLPCVDFYEQFQNINSIMELNEFFISLIEDMGNHYSEDKNYKHSDIIADIKSYIDKNYNDNNLTVGSLADFVGVTPTYLGILFKDELEMTVMQYINIVRISHAKDMLENTNHHIDYISSAVGYGNISRFIRNFKKDSGITPHHYRVISNKEKLS